MPGPSTLKFPVPESCSFRRWLRVLKSEALIVVLSNFFHLTFSLRTSVSISTNHLKNATPSYQPFDIFLACHFCTKNMWAPFLSVWEQQAPESPRDSVNPSSKDEEIANKRISIYRCLPPTSPAWNYLPVGARLPLLHSVPTDTSHISIYTLTDICIYTYTYIYICVFMYLRGHMFLYISCRMP